jgi:PAS domain S-box-containing protein
MTRRRENVDTQGNAAALRKVAERRVASLQATRPLPPEELARLVHELRVHQVELELQNEELARTRSALEDSLDRYTELYDFAPVGYLTLGRAGEIRELNLAAARLLGLDRAVLVGRSLVPLVSPGSREILQRFLVEVASAPASCVVEPEGAPSVRLRLRGEAAPDGVRLRVVVEDVTELLRAELDRASLTLAVEHIDGSVVITDPGGRIVFVNPAFERITGYSHTEAIGQTPRLLKSGAHDQAFYAKLWATLLAGAVWRGRFINRRKDGALLTEEATISPLRDARGAIAYFVAVRRDVSAELSLEAQLLQTRRMETVGQLAGGIAHDFNNLLLVIKGSTEFALEELPEDSPARREVLEIQTAADRAATLTRQLLAFSRKQLLRPEVVDLDALTAGMIRMLRRVLGENVQLQFRPTRTLWNVLADPGQIEQIVMNLAVNARDALLEGGTLVFETSNVDAATARATAALAEAPPGEYVKLTVADNGCGMSPEVRSHIFEPFYSTKPKDKGTGLGLATVYGIVKQSGGYISCSSDAGRGTLFSLYFPRHLAKAPADQARPSAAPLGDDAARRPKGAILVVEDEASVRAVVRRILVGAGYEVLTAQQGEEALAVCKEHGAQLALVLSDVVMPVMGGSELRRRLALEQPGLEVVFMSGYPDDLGTAADEQVSVLSKPFSPSSLLAKVRERIDARSQRA